MSPDRSVGSVLRAIATHPWQTVGRHWNYKAAILSAAVRSMLFFAVNLHAGLAAATAAMTTELLFRFTTAGFYGALTEAFREAEPRTAATIAAMLLLPAVSHSLEFATHWLRGTSDLTASIGASVIFSAFSTGFNLFAMREGALIVGAGRRPVGEDLREMPRLIAKFVVTVTRTAVRSCP